MPSAQLVHRSLIMLKAASAALKIMLSEATGAAGVFRKMRTIPFNMSTNTSIQTGLLVGDKSRIGLLYSEKRATESRQVREARSKGFRAAWLQRGGLSPSRFVRVAGGQECSARVDHFFAAGGRRRARRG